MNVSRVHRLVHLIEILQSGESCSADTLAERLGVGRRTLFRDLNVLKEAGVPYEYDRSNGTYALTRSYLVTSINFTLQEALALTLLVRKGMKRQIVPEYRAALEGAAKLEGVIPTAIRDACGELLDGVEVHYWPMSEIEGAVNVLADLRSAAAKHLKARIVYDSYFEQRQIELILHPYRLAFIRRGWYVIGYSELSTHREVRMLKIERIIDCKILEETFDPPDNFSLDGYFDHAWHMIKGSPRYKVRIEFTDKMAGNVEEVIWHKSQHTWRDEEGRFFFEADVDGIDEISWWVLGYGDHAIVHQPHELRELVRQRAERMVARYNGNAGGV